MPDTDVCSVVTPSEATKILQAIHLKHFKALGVKGLQWPKRVCNGQKQVVYVCHKSALHDLF